MESFAAPNHKDKLPPFAGPRAENQPLMLNSPLPRQRQRAASGISPGYASSGTLSNFAESMQQQRVARSAQDLGASTERCFPERPNEPNCMYYIRTGQCAYAMNCKFNHPSDRKLATTSIGSEKGEYPEHIGQPECQYYMKTGTCKFGPTCKFHHPRERLGRFSANILGFPLRQDERDCPYYMQTGLCKFGATCKFNHPQPTQIKGLVTMPRSMAYPSNSPLGTPSTHLFQTGMQSWSLASRPQFMPRPRFRTFTPLIVQQPQTMVAITGWNPYQARLGPLGSLDVQHSTIGGANLLYGTSASNGLVSASGGIRTTHNNYVQGPGAVGSNPSSIQTMPTTSRNTTTLFPERPGQLNCDYYMKTGDCKYRLSCRFNHPKERALSLPNCAISPLGLPLRQGARQCPFYMQHRTCKFGVTCKFDHPMPTVTYNPSTSSLTELAVASYAPEMAVVDSGNSIHNPKALSNGHLDKQLPGYGAPDIARDSGESNTGSNTSSTASLETMGHESAQSSANSSS